MKFNTIVAAAVLVSGTQAGFVNFIKGMFGGNNQVQGPEDFLNIGTLTGKFDLKEFTDIDLNNGAKQKMFEEMTKIT